MENINPELIDKKNQTPSDSSTGLGEGVESPRPLKSTNETMDELNFDLAPKEDMELKTMSFHLKMVEEEEDGKIGVVKGYASTFGNVDLGNDVVEAGAFTKSIAEMKAFPLLIDHSPKMRDLVGFQTFTTDAKGLFADMKINLEKQVGRETYSDLKMAQSMGKNIGLSIGYRVIKDEWDKQSGVRYLKEVQLYESSFTLFPMNEEASVTSVKHRVRGAEEKELLELKDYIQSLLAGKPLKDTSLKEADLTEIKQFINNLKD